MDKLFYYLKISVENAEVSCSVNGFPVYEMTSEDAVINQIPINLPLIGKNNQLTIKVKPLGAMAKISGGVAPYGQGDMVGTDDEKSGELTFDFSTNKAEVKTFTFDNDRFDFSKVIIDTPVINDQESIRSFGGQLIGWLDGKNAEKLVDAMKPKLEDTATAFGVPPQLMVENMLQMLQNDLLKQPLIKRTESELVLIPHCDGRLWEIQGPNGETLIYSKDESGEMSLPVYVGEIDGALKVVR